MKRYRSWQVFAGFNSPQLFIQIAPLEWGIGGGFGRKKVSIRIGPVAIAVYWDRADWKAEARKR